jgi:hypothetical protein
MIDTLLANLGQPLGLVLPAHSRRARQLSQPGLPRWLRVIMPVGYLDFIALPAQARLTVPPVTPGPPAR